MAGALVVAALLSWWLLARARARREGQRELDAAEAEVAWLARDLLPQLRSAGSLGEAVGGWRVAAQRVAAAEDRLTVLAVDEKHPAAARARALRDGVRKARARADALAQGGGTPDGWVRDLDNAIADLESALAHDEEKP